MKRYKKPKQGKIEISVKELKKIKYDVTKEIKKLVASFFRPLPKPPSMAIPYLPPVKKKNRIHFLKKILIVISPTHFFFPPLYSMGTQLHIDVYIIFSPIVVLHCRYLGIVLGEICV